MKSAGPSPSSAAHRTPDCVGQRPELADKCAASGAGVLVRAFYFGLSGFFVGAALPDTARQKRRAVFCGARR